MRVKRSLLSALIIACSLAAAACGTDERGATPVSAARFHDSVGVSIHMSYWDTVYGQADRIADSLADLGVRHVRDGIWYSTDAAWNDTLYRQQEIVASRGVKFIYGLDLRPTSGTVAERLGVIADRLAGTAEAIEGPNEPDLFEKGAWAPRLRAFMPELYDAVKKHPDRAIRALPVVGPSFALGGASSSGDLSGSMDVGNVHPYTGCRSPTPSHLRDVSDEYAQVSGGKPWWATEVGFHTAINYDPNSDAQPACDERTAAVYTLRTVLEHFKFGVERTYLYELIDLRPDPGKVDPESNFGLLRNDFSSKPAFTALKNMLEIVGTSGPAELEPFGFSASGRCRHLLIQKADGSYVVFLWRLDSVWDRHARQPIGVAPEPVTITVPDARWVREIRPMESTEETPLTLRDQRVKVDVGADPIALHAGTSDPPEPGRP
jgi:hypothetical protein